MIFCVKEGLGLKSPNSCETEASLDDSFRGEFPAAFFVRYWLGLGSQSSYLMEASLADSYQQVVHVIFSVDRVDMVVAQGVECLPLQCWCVEVDFEKF